MLTITYKNYIELNGTKTNHLTFKRYQFDNGVIVIKHWRMANALRKDRYTPTNFKEELAKLKIKSNGTYTFSDDGCRVVATCLPQDSIGKVSIDKNSIVKDSKDKDIKEKDIDKSISKKKTVYYPDDEMLESAFQEYLTMRKKLKSQYAPTWHYTEL